MQSSLVASDALTFHVLLQLVVIVGAARTANIVFRRLGQPGVVGELVAGLMLGPSLFGHFFPTASVALFSAQAVSPITVISDVGLLFLMFQIGLDFDIRHLLHPKNRNATVGIAVASVCTPFVLGFGIGELSAPVLAPNVQSLTYSLFCGVALSITAMPVLGRILREYDLTRTDIGVIAISAAAVNDVTGWVLLAAVATYASATLPAHFVGLQLAGIAALLAVTWFLLRQVANWLLKRLPVTAHRELPLNVSTAILCLIFLMGMCTSQLGIFASFGGFLAGLLFQNRTFADAWRAQVGTLVQILFVPVFFAFTGLRTNVLGLSGERDCLWLALALVAAIFGKFAPTYIASRASGFAPREAAMLGSLMNTRGLMELIVLNIGFGLGYLPQKVFTIFVIMAVVTTMMTGPLLRFLLPCGHSALPRGAGA